MQEREVAIAVDDGEIAGTLRIPDELQGLVIFAHGSGSSRHSSRNRFVADVLNRSGLATLLMDLLTAREDEIDRHSAELRFDIELLAERVVAASDWARNEVSLSRAPLGYFGASTGAAAALVAAAERDDVAAVVSRGGRPDLAGDALAKVKAPTLLIVGSHDPVVLQLNKRAAAQMRYEKELAVIAGATHLFEEPGALEQVADLSQQWFSRLLRADGAPFDAASQRSGSFDTSG